MRASASLDRMLWALRHEPPRTLFFKALGEVGYRRLLLLARPLHVPAAHPRADPPLSFGRLDASGAAEYAALRPDARPADAEARWRAGHVCFVARHEGRAIAACWAATRNARADFLGCAVPLARGDVYFFDAYTRPEYRGQGVAPALCGEQLTYFRAQGYARALRLTLPENDAALRAHAKSGFVPIGMIGRVKLGPWQHVLHRSWVPGAQTR